MNFLLDHPDLFALASLFTMLLVAWAGFWAKQRMRRGKEDDRDDSVMVLSATLTLLGLILGFTFAMATSRYDQRKLYEEEEANAIRTEYLRADLLPAVKAAALKNLLRQYLSRRIASYEAADEAQVQTSERATTELQDQLWGATRTAAKESDAGMGLAVPGMTDVMNAQGNSRFAAWNRIPHSAWMLMWLIALFANLLIGYTKKPSPSGKGLLLVLPTIVAVAFFLIADIDSPRGGAIQINPVDLINLSLRMQV